MSVLGLNLDSLRIVGREAAASALTRSRRNVATDGLGILQEIRFAWKSRLGMVVGMIYGGFIPAVTLVACHFEMPTLWTRWRNGEELAYWGILGLAVAVVGCLLFSGLTVFEGGKHAFRHKGKALGFVVATEAVMVFSTLWPMRLAALTLLVLANAFVTGKNLALDDQRNGDDDR
jgi:hypothetical protein